MIMGLVCLGRKPYLTAVTTDVVRGGESVPLVAAVWFMNERNEHREERATMASTDDNAPMRPWQWWVSGLLLLATMLNYMDRQTLANLSVRITDELSLSQERYGDLELAFGWAFAAGSLVFRTRLLNQCITKRRKFFICCSSEL